MRGGRVIATVEPANAQPEEALDAMWALFEATYEGVARDRFEADLRRKDVVIVLRDGATIVGLSTMTTCRGDVDGRPYVAIFSGDTVVHRDYWGQTALQRAFAMQVFKTWWRNLGTPTYWYLISKGFKTYLLLARNWVNAWPVRDAPIPAFELAVLRDLGARMFGPQYDPERHVVVFDPPAGRLRAGVAPPQHAADDPDVAYFVAANPGHADGHELCCLGRLEWRVFARFAIRQALPFLRRRAR